jgi:hypothetical protein
MTEKKKDTGRKTYPTLLSARFPSADKEARKKIETERIKEQLKRTAAEQYTVLNNDCAIILDLIGQELAAHATRAAKEPKHWGWVGDVASVRETLENVLAQFMVGRFGSETEAHRAIADHLDEMRK